MQLENPLKELWRLNMENGVCKQAVIDTRRDNHGKIISQKVVGWKEYKRMTVTEWGESEAGKAKLKEQVGNLPKTVVMYSAKPEQVGGVYRWKIRIV